MPAETAQRPVRRYAAGATCPGAHPPPPSRCQASDTLSKTAAAAEFEKTRFQACPFLCGRAAICATPSCQVGNPGHQPSSARALLLESPKRTDITDAAKGVISRVSQP